VITQRVRMQQRPSSATASVSACAASCFVARVRSAGQSRRRKRLPPSRQRATWLSACRRRAKRPSSSTRQANEVGRISRRAAPPLSHLILVRLVTGEPRRRLAHKIPLHKAASEVRYIVNFNNGSTTGPNGVSEFILTAHVVPVVTTKHSPAERRERESEANHATAHPLSLPDSRSQVLSRATNFAARFFFERKCHQHRDPQTGESGGAKSAPAGTWAKKLKF
jgi:hypothetical protein